jgi:ubiquinone/menaquinone biosynthesis C-methylase UbiE
MAEGLRQESDEAGVAVQPVKAAYDSLATEYEHRWGKYIDVTLAKVTDALTLEGSERILDVACGTGELERRLFARWPRLKITGVDLSPEMLARAREKQLRGDVFWMEGDASNLTAVNGPFDILICANSFHCFPEPAHCLEEFRRNLTPGGSLVLVDWCDDYLMCKLCSIWLKLTDPAFYRTYTLRSCRELLTAAGFQVTHGERFRACWPWGMMLFVCQTA